MNNSPSFLSAKASVALKLDGYYVWDCAVIRAEGRYHMFSSRWPASLGFGANWLLNSEIIHSISDTPEGPYRYFRTVLPRRGRNFFDGMNTHNTCIRSHAGRFYLYYMGTTYEDSEAEDFCAVWNKKRIGAAVADEIMGPFHRFPLPLLFPRTAPHWDATATTNPAVCILPDGTTYMIYKSRAANDSPLQLGVAVAPSPEGPFTRLSDRPIFDFSDPDLHVEDPYLWYDESRKKFCLIAKDDCKNGSAGLTGGGWGSGFYAESDDCLHFSIFPYPVYKRELHWQDGTQSFPINLERPWILFDEDGKPTHLFCASGNGPAPYAFEGETYIVCLRLETQA